MKDGREREREKEMVRKVRGRAGEGDGNHVHLQPRAPNYDTPHPPTASVARGCRHSIGGDILTCRSTSVIKKYLINRENRKMAGIKKNHAHEKNKPIIMF